MDKNIAIKEMKKQLKKQKQYGPSEAKLITWVLSIPSEEGQTLETWALESLFNRAFSSCDQNRFAIDKAGQRVLMNLQSVVGYLMVSRVPG